MAGSVKHNLHICPCFFNNHSFLADNPIGSVPVDDWKQKTGYKNASFFLSRGIMGNEPIVEGSTLYTGVTLRSHSRHLVLGREKSFIHRSNPALSQL